MSDAQKGLPVCWDPEAEEALEKIKAESQQRALQILSSIQKAAIQMASHQVTNKVRRLTTNGHLDKRIRIPCGHHRAIARRDGDVLTILQLLYRDEQTYKKKARKWHEV